MGDVVTEYSISDCGSGSGSSDGTILDPALIVNVVSEHFKCQICLEVLKCPVMCPLAHNFCKSCLTQALINKKECPVCRTSMNDESSISYNRALQGAIEDVITVRCSTTLNTQTPTVTLRNSTNLTVESSTKRKRVLECSDVERCNWQGPMKGLSRHLLDCEFALVDCPHPGCDIKILRSGLHFHKEVCRYRRVMCLHCQHEFRHSLLSDHSEVCAMRPIPCVHGCKSSTTGETTLVRPCDMAQHLEEVCSDKTIPCPFYSIGCKETAPRRNMKAHVEDAYVHVLLLLAEVESQKNIITQQQEYIQRLQLNMRGILCEKDADECFALYNACHCGKRHAWDVLKELSDKGNVCAQVYVMGIMFEGASNIVSKNREAGEALATTLLPWLDREVAGDCCNKHALYGMALCHEHDAIDIPLSEDNPVNSQSVAFQFYIRAATLGHAVAQCSVANYYESGGDVVPVDKLEAMRWYKLAATQGEPTAQYCLGHGYENGEGVTANDSDAFKWYSLAADQGDATSQFTVGSCYYNGGCGVNIDYEEALRWFKLAAKQGDSNAEVHVGLCYERGEGGLTINKLTAMEWYRLAAAKNNPTAQEYIGCYYEKGDGGVVKSKVEALRWHRLAADQGCPEAQHSMGEYYEYGQGGLAKCLREARKWYSLAAEQGYPESQNNIGWFYNWGRGGLTKNKFEAYRWYMEAAEQGNLDAQYSVGLCHQTGDGGATEDVNEANKWFSLAARQGHKGAIKVMSKQSKNI